ncbi:MAG: replication factor C large subunit, partial [Candidatus Bathyarchaeia archaeon]
AAYISMISIRPWTEKHRPSSISEFVGNTEALNSVRRWLDSWTAGPPSKKGALLYGPPGVGKTLSVSLLAQELNFDLVEMNASDNRTREAIERIAGMAASQSDLYKRRRIVLLDELEGMSGDEDRGGLAAIASLLKNARSPVILTAVNVWNPKFTTIRENCLLVEFKRIPTRSIITRLKKICTLEGVEADEDALQVIAERARGDLRSAIIDLQAISQGRSRLTYMDVRWLETRNRQESIFDVLRTIFNAETIHHARNALNTSDVDYEMVFEWIYENAPYQIQDIKELVNAMRALSNADILLARAQRKHHWHLLPYALEEFTAGVAFSRRQRPKEWIPFRFPQRIRQMSQTQAQRAVKIELARKIGQKCHTSTKKANIHYLPYLRILAQQDAAKAARVIEYLNLTKEEAIYLTKTGHQ